MKKKREATDCDDSTMSTCVGCGLRLPKQGGCTHRYIVSSPECWGIFGVVLSREYENALLYGAVHQITVDAYAAQHTTQHPAKSLVSHLLSLYCSIALGKKQHLARDALVRFVNSRQDFPTLTPPRDLGPLTVIDVFNAPSDEEHIRIVKAWGRQIWDAWHEHHDLIASLVVG